MDHSAPRPVVFVGSSKRDLLALPDDVRREFGHGLWMAQLGEMPDNAKVLKGFGGAGVIELVERHDGDTYRAVYTVRFEGVLYVLHVFQKKSKSGVATPRPDIELVHERLKAAAAIHEARKG